MWGWMRQPLYLPDPVLQLFRILSMVLNMAVSQSLIASLFASVNLSTLLIISLTAPLFYLCFRTLYRLSPLHPLDRVPGPLLARISSLWLNYHAYIGDECTVVHRLHERYGPIVRNGPDSVDIADGVVLHQIYVEKGGFPKPEFYRNFDIDGHQSIFSTTDSTHRAPRAKVVMPLFSTTSLRIRGHAIADAAIGLLGRIGREVKRASAGNRRFDILELCRAFAIDAVSGYLFNTKYGGCDEDIPKLEQEEAATNDAKKPSINGMTASQMVDSFVAVGRVWYLPPWAFQLYENVIGFLYPDVQAQQSMCLVDAFVNQVVDRASDAKAAGSYPARLLDAGFSTSEVRAQCKDLIFAGTDSTAMNLATICFMLIRSPETYRSLQKEILSANPTDDELQSLPYLKGVIKEGLRLSMANPSRLPRVIPSGGLTYRDLHIPAGTVVSCTPYELHLNPSIYTHPALFNPERWGSGSEEMNRDFIAFGLGSRQCIARNLATAELFKAVSMIAAEDALRGLKTVSSQIDIIQWFNSHVIEGKIEVEVE
jgi:cytochrome P450